MVSSGGGQDLQKFMVLTTSGGKTLKNLSVLTTLYRKMPIFFMISQKVGPFFLDFTESLEAHRGGGRQNFRGEFAPPRTATDHGIYYINIINQQFSDYFAKQINFTQNVLYINIVYLNCSILM